MSYPATIEVTSPEKIANWRPLVQWIMAIPHFIVLYALGVASQVVALLSWFAILFTGKMPEGFANLQALYIRYTLRTQAHAGFLHEEYPPFEFATTPAEPGGTPVDISLSPALEDRNRLTVGLRFFWAIPAFLYAFVIWIVVAICWFIAFFAVLFTGHWPDGLRAWAMNGLRVSVRLNAYWLLLTDDYPPFSTD